jgi:hypothetical protein
VNTYGGSEGVTPPLLDTRTHCKYTSRSGAFQRTAVGSRTVTSGAGILPEKQLVLPRPSTFYRSGFNRFVYRTRNVCAPGNITSGWNNTAIAQAPQRPTASRLRSGTAAICSWFITHYQHWPRRARPRTGCESSVHTPERSALESSSVNVWRLADNGR